MHTRIIKALVDAKGKTVGGQVVPMPAGSYHEVSGFDLDYYLAHPDVFTVYAEASGPPVYADIHPVTGGISLVVSGRNANYSAGKTRKGRAFRGTWGRRIALWSGASLQNSGGDAALITTTDVPWRPDSATKILRLTKNAATSFGQQICETSDYATTATVEGVGIWARNSGTASLSCQMVMYNAAANHEMYYNFTVDPTDGDWKFITVAPVSNTANTFVWGTDGVHFVRISQRDAGGDAWGAGAVCDFGATYIGTKGRPRFILSNDDTTNTVLHPGNSTAGWPASGRSFQEIVEYYGFKGTLYCIPSVIGTAGYLTANELLGLQDKGWAIGSHSYSHPTGSTDVAGSATGTGLRLLGPYGYALLSDPRQFTASQTGVLCTASNDDTAIYNDVIRGIESCDALGIWNADHLFAIPQGGWDTYVRSAIMRTGIKHIRAISSYNNYNSITVGYPSGGGGTGSSLAPGGWIHQGDAVQTDGALTIGNCTAYVDAVIAAGATGSNYHHGMGTANAAVLDGLVSYLKTKFDLGLIDVVTATQAAFDDGLI